jgi:hypothetical protein
MNPNIEVITPELWAVHSGYIKAGWIQELTPVPGVESINADASLTNDGIMILKKESELYPTLKQFVPKIMKHTDAELEHCITTMKGKVNPDAYEKLYLNVLQWEIKRRCVRAEYLNSLPKPTFKDRIKKFLRKAGEKYGYHSNSD